MEQLKDRDESFRDKISTVDAEGKRVWVYPKKPKGKFTNYRTLFAWGLLAIFFITPFLTLNDMPLLMLNVPERHFVIFGAMFWPQDFHLFLIGTIALFIFIFGKLIETENGPNKTLIGIVLYFSLIFFATTQVNRRRNFER